MVPPVSKEDVKEVVALEGEPVGWGGMPRQAETENGKDLLKALVYKLKFNVLSLFTFKWLLPYVIFALI